MMIQSSRQFPTVGFSAYGRQAFLGKQAPVKPSVVSFSANAENNDTQASPKKPALGTVLGLVLAFIGLPVGGYFIGNTTGYRQGKIALLNEQAETLKQQTADLALKQSQASKQLQEQQQAWQAALAKPLTEEEALAVLRDQKAPEVEKINAALQLLGDEKPSKNFNIGFSTLAKLANPRYQQAVEDFQSRNSIRTAAILTRLDQIVEPKGGTQGPVSLYPSGDAKAKKPVIITLPKYVTQNPKEYATLVAGLKELFSKPQ